MSLGQHDWAAYMRRSRRLVAVPCVLPLLPCTLCFSCLVACFVVADTVLLFLSFGCDLLVAAVFDDVIGNALASGVVGDEIGSS